MLAGIVDCVWSDYLLGADPLLRGRLGKALPADWGRLNLPHGTVILALHLQLLAFTSILLDNCVALIWQNFG